MSNVDNEKNARKLNIWLLKKSQSNFIPLSVQRWLKIIFWLYRFQNTSYFYALWIYRVIFKHAFFLNLKSKCLKHDFLLCIRWEQWKNIWPMNNIRMFKLMCKYIVLFASLLHFFIIIILIHWNVQISTIFISFSSFSDINRLFHICSILSTVIPYRITYNNDILFFSGWKALTRISDVKLLNA